MLISALVPLALAGALDADRFSLGVPVEVDLVGLAAGVRPELLWRPVRADGAMHVRAATGIIAGPELVFVPFSLTLRGQWFPRRDVHPLAGIGAELQTFFTVGHPVVARSAIVTELGVDVEITEQWSTGLVLEPNFAPSPLFGFGFAVRAGVTRRW